MAATLLAGLALLACGDEVHPTLAEIFKPPRVIGTRPQEVAISASGRFVLWRYGAQDAEQPKLDWWLAAADGSGEPQLLFPAEPRVDLQWSPRGDELLVRRNGWIEQMDVGAATAEGRAARPLFECGERTSRLVFTRDGGRALFVAGDGNDLWVLDLATGARSAPAAALKNRGRWFQLLEECDSIACFAAAPGAPEAPATPPAPGSATEKTEAAKRVLWFVPLGGDGAPRATKLEEGDGIEVSADGRFVSLAHVEPETKRQLVVADYLTEAVSTVPVRDNLAGDLAAPTTLALYDVAKEEKVTPALDEGSRYMLLDTEWSPSGARLLVHRLSGDVHSRQILVLDPQTRRSWPLYSERDDAWIGGPQLVAAWRRDGAEVVFSSEQSGSCHLYAAPAEGGAVRALTSGAFEVQALQLLEDGGHALIQTNEHDPAEQELALLDLASGARHELASPAGCVGRFAASRDGSRVAFLHEQLGVPADVWTIGTEAGAAPVQLSETVPEAFRALALPPPEIVEFQNAQDGTKLRALLYRPETSAGATPYGPTHQVPAVVFVHGAGYLQNVTRSMTAYPVNMLFHHRLARMGFAVLDVDYRHSSGYGRKFRTDVYGFMGGKDLDDELAGVDYLKSLGFVDTSRVGIYGGSYGGFLTLMALFTKPDVFACGAALRSVTDWRTYNSWYTNARLGDPKKDAENYRRSSPIDHAEGLTKPLLLLHGMKDSNVFAQDTIRLIEKLIQLGKEFDAMLYPSQDHAFTDPESWIDEYRRIERLFLRELKPEPADGRGRGAPPVTNPTLPRPL